MNSALTTDISEEASCFDCRNVGLLVGMRPDSVQGNLEFFQWDSPTDFDYFSVGFSAIFQWIFRAEKDKVAAILRAR